MSTTEQTSSTTAAVPSPADDLRIFVGNLPLSADAKLLKSVFREANARAQVNVARVTRAQHGKARYAIVTFKSEEDKSKGVDSLAKKFDSTPGVPQGTGATEGAEAPAESSEAASKPAAQNGEAKSTKLRFGAAPAKPKTPKGQKKPAATSDVEATAAAADANNSGEAPKTTTQVAAPKNKTPSKPKRVPTKFVPRPSAVYVTLPPHTEADEVRELLSGFPSVEIKLGHKRGRTVARRTKRVEIPERTYAVVTVGEEYQQRAIQQLDGKELREFRISAKPSSQRLLAENAKEEAREAKKEDDKAPEAQPNSEHAEHAGNAGSAKAGPSV